MPDLKYTAPPTCAAFMKSEAFGRIIAGPIGSGKTVSCIMELLRRAMAQRPGADGFRYTRFAVVRQTLKQLKDTVLKDCNTWLAGLGEWKVSESTFYLHFGDVRSEWIFIPLEDASDQRRLLSSQLTGVWGSEVIEMNYDILPPVVGRIGRYPNDPSRGVCTWRGLIADTNMPMEMSDWHHFFLQLEQHSMPDWQLFRQPSGLSPEAENLNYLNQTDDTIALPVNHPERLAMGRTYYSKLVDFYGESSDWVRRYVKAEYGPDPSGLVVFRESFIPHFHCVETMVIPGYPLLIGQDFGREPWSLICQMDHRGRLLVHEEVAAYNIGLEKHVLQSLRPRLLQDRYRGLDIVVVGDPAGVAKGTVSEETSFDALKRLGLSAFPAVTNDIDPRLRAVESLLQRQTDGGPSLAINKQGAPQLVAGLAGGYRYTKTKEGQRRSLPDKNEFSHVVDALQYVCLVVNGGLVSELQRRARPRPTLKRAAMPASAWT